MNALRSRIVGYQVIPLISWQLHQCPRVITALETLSILKAVVDHF